MNLTELKNYLAQFSNTVKLHPNFLFRGQANKSWELEPSFTRLVKNKKLNRNKALQLERESVYLFSISASKLLPIDKTIDLTLSKFKSSNAGGIDSMGWFSVMQHFSAPTRQLDWTMSPWVALYFACCERDDNDGVIWIADFNKVVKFGEEKLNGSNFITLMIDAKSQDIITFFMAPNTNERIEAQQSRFSMCTNPLSSHESVLNESDGLNKIEIPKESKPELLRELHQMNITAKTLFPGLDGLGKSIYEYCHLWDETSFIV